LFNHINSKESFDYISNLLLNSLNTYKDSYSLENNLRVPEPVPKDIADKKFDDLYSNRSGGDADYLAISNDIQSILSNCPDLSTTQKLDYCNSQRYFMKMYMRNIVLKLKSQ
jgi:hypothetical protein